MCGNKPSGVSLRRPRDGLVPTPNWHRLIRGRRRSLRTRRACVFRSSPRHAQSVAVRARGNVVSHARHVAVQTLQALQERRPVDVCPAACQRPGPELGAVHDGGAANGNRSVNHPKASQCVWRQAIPNRPMSTSNAPSLTVPPPVLLTEEIGTISIRMAGSAVIFNSVRRPSTTTSPQFGCRIFRSLGDCRPGFSI